MNKRIGLVVAGLAAAALMAGGTAFAAASSSPPMTDSAGNIYGCYDSGGNLKVINPSVTTTCPKGYLPLDWNQIGSMDSMIGSPCDKGTPYAGTLQVSYAPQPDGTDTVTAVCKQTNPSYGLNVTVSNSNSADIDVIVGSAPAGISCVVPFGQTVTCSGLFSGTVVLTEAEQRNPGGPGGGAVFWTGCDSSTNYTNCTVNMTGIRDVSLAISS